MATICPSCEQADMRPHCDDKPACTWLRCGCGVIVDWQTDRAVDRNGKPLSL